MRTTQAEPLNYFRKIIPSSIQYTEMANLLETTERIYAMMSR